MREIDAFAHLNRWRDRTVEVCVLCAGLLGCAMVRPTVATALLTLLVVVTSFALAGVPRAAFLRAGRWPLGFLVVGSLPLCVSVAFDGHGPSLAFSREGWEVALRTAMRSVAALSATLLLALTTPFPRMARLLRVAKTPVVLVELLGLVYRSIFALDESLRTSRVALVARGGFRHRAAVARSLPLLASSAFVRSFSRASRLEAALRSRSGGESLDVLLPPLRPRPLGLAFAVVVPISVCALSRLLGGIHVR
jgi:cobalt/nickel transport system permease protein